MPGCASCRRIRQYCKENQLDCEEFNLFQTLLSKSKLDEMFENMDSRRHLMIDEKSRLWKSCHLDLNTASPEELKTLVKESPLLLNRPIMDFDDDEMLAHCQELAQNACKKNCPQYDICANLK
jgi:regulatory protein spx